MENTAPKGTKLTKIPIFATKIEKMDARIEKFIKKHHVMTLTTVADGQPWVCQVFYAYLADEHTLVFTSGADTRHIIEGLANPKVAVSIVLESKLVARLQGVQIEGTFAQAPDNKYRAAFSKRFPVIPLKPDTMWTVRIETAKYTDNTLGFGTKLHYPSSEPK